MLVLKLNAGERVRIGSLERPLILTLKQVRDPEATVRLEASAAGLSVTYILRAGRRTQVEWCGARVNVFVTRTQLLGGGAWLGFEAPQSVRIVRCEIDDRVNRQE
jgi:hypothetical protein